MQVDDAPVSIKATAFIVGTGLPSFLSCSATGCGGTITTSMIGPENLKLLPLDVRNGMCKLKIS